MHTHTHTHTHTHGQTTTTEDVPDTLALIDNISSRVEELRNDLNVTNARLNNGSFLNGTTFSSEINVFESCNTTIVSTCPIPAPMPPSHPISCETQDVILYEVSDVCNP